MRPGQRVRPNFRVFWLGLSITLSFLILVTFVWGVQASSQKAGQSAQLQETIHLGFLYWGGDLPGAVNAANDFADLLSQETGLDVQAEVSTCAADLIHRLGTGTIDIAPLWTPAYILAHDYYGVEARLVSIRFGLPYYRGQINVRSDSGYTSLWDLQGTSFAAPDPASTSGYIAPAVMISLTTGMAPEEFFSSVTFVGSHPEVIRQVYTGTVDCGASFVDARDVLVEELPDVLEIVSVLTTTEQIPNDPWVFNPALDPPEANSLVEGIIAVAETITGDLALETIFETSLDGYTTVEDSDYDFARLLFAGLGIDIFSCQGTEIIGPEGGTITFLDGQTTLEFGSNAITDTAEVTHTVLFAGDLLPAGDLSDINSYFDITAVYQSSRLPVNVNQPITMTVDYSDDAVGPTREDTLALYFWDESGGQWVLEPTSIVDVVSNTVTAMPDHFSRWAILGETNRLYLPAVLRNP